jgi:hypothetical protein
MFYKCFKLEVHLIAFIRLGYLFLSDLRSMVMVIKYVQERISSVPEQRRTKSEKVGSLGLGLYGTKGGKGIECASDS